MRTIFVDFDMDYWQESGQLEQILLTPELYAEIEDGYKVKWLESSDEYQEGIDWTRMPEFYDLDDIAGKALIYQIDQVSYFSELTPGMQGIIGNKLNFDYLKHLSDIENLSELI